MFERQQSGEGDGTWIRQLSGEEENFHKEKTWIARRVMHKLLKAHTHDDYTGEDGLAPPSADVCEKHFNRRRLANDVLAATEEYLLGEMDDDDDDTPDDSAPKEGTWQADVQKCASSEFDGITCPEIRAALEEAVKEHKEMVCRLRAENPEAAPAMWDRAVSGGLKRLLSGFSEVSKGLSNADANLGRTVSNASKTSQTRKAGIAHDHMNMLLKTNGLGMAKLTPAHHEKPVLKDPMGLRCVEHLHCKKWTNLAREIRETIYDPDFYDDGTYGPMYVRLAIHGAATYDASDGTGGLEGGAMRFKPEYSDAHNKFCKEIIKRQHELIKVPNPWASYADIQCLCAYVALECANGPIIPFTPGRRDVIPFEKANLNGTLDDYHLEEDDFLVLNYRERGDAGCEDEPADCPDYKQRLEELRLYDSIQMRGWTGNLGHDHHDRDEEDENNEATCPATGKKIKKNRTAEDLAGCPFLTKKKVYPGRVPGPEQGHLGKCCETVTQEMEQKEWAAVAEEITEIFVHRMGASHRYTVALIAGGHSLGRCHPQISGYAGPWQSNPGYFNNVYCKKLLSEDWKLVDRNMEDCSGDMITGVKPYGMRRQYVNKDGKGDLMMLVSDMALLKDPEFGHWIRTYAKDNELLKDDFKTAFKWATELGFTPPPEKTGLDRLKFMLRKLTNNVLHWFGEFCADGEGDADGSGSGGGGAADMPKVGNPYTPSEVAAHASKTDCWVIINGQVCDLTKFMNTHPGGVQAIMDFAGKDASREWNTIHTRNAIQAIAPDTIIGHVVDSK